MTVKPYKNIEGGKKSQVASMFNNIAPKYDLLNHTLSLGIDRLWRKRAIRLIGRIESPKVLDVATGTGDLAIALHKRLGAKVTGLDISSEMLKIASTKIKRDKILNVDFVMGDSESLPFDDNQFDAVTVAFGVRNFENLDKGLAEMMRVLRPKGKMIILEFSKPQLFPLKQLYNFYFKKILPFIGGLVSKDKDAYTYLPESVDHFPQGNEFIKVLQEIGMMNVSQRRQTFGIATIYYCEKP